MGFAGSDIGLELRREDGMEMNTKKIWMWLVMAAMAFLLLAALLTPGSENRRATRERHVPRPTSTSSLKTEGGFPSLSEAAATLIAVIFGGVIAAGTAWWVHRLDRRADLAVSTRTEFYEPTLEALHAAHHQLHQAVVPSKIVLSGETDRPSHYRHIDLNLAWWERFEARGLVLRIPDQLRRDMGHLMETADEYQVAFDAAQTPVAARFAETYPEQARMLETYKSDLELKIVEALSGLSKENEQIELGDVPEAKKVWQLRDQLRTQVDSLIVGIEKHVATLVRRYEAGRRKI